MAGRSRSMPIDPRPHRADKFEIDLIARQERFERLDRSEVAAGMIADRDLFSGKLLRSRNW